MLFGKELKELLDAPLQMLDRVEFTETGAIGVRRISMNEAVFQGHFPGTPVLPGVLQVAAMAQIAKVCWHRVRPEQLPYLAELSRVKFRTPVTPGMTLRIECAIVADEGDTMRFQVKNYVGDALASSGILCFGVRPADWFAPLDNEGGIGHEEPALGAIEIQKYLPHRFPFILVDGAYGIGKVNPETGLLEISGYKNVGSEDAMVKGIYPGYCLVESGAQLGCLAVLALPENEGKLGFFMSIDEAHFYHGATPGDRVDISCKIEPRGKFGIGSCVFYVGKTKIAEGGLKFAIVEHSRPINL